MRIIKWVIFLILLSISVAAVDLRPQGNIIGQSIYSIYGFKDINGTNLYNNGSLVCTVANGLCLGVNGTTSIGFTGTTTKTLNLERQGLTNLTASFTDIDTTYTAGSYLYLTSTEFNVNESSLNNTIDERSINEDTNNYTSEIGFTGTTTKTLNLARIGMDNLTASFTDSDTTYTADEQYINLLTSVFTLNETNLNATIDARGGASYTAGTGLILTVAVFSLNQTYIDNIYYNKTTSDDRYWNEDGDAGLTGLYDGTYDLNSGGYINCTTVDTGQGANELYAMNQDVETTDAVTFATVDTGQGANELFYMNQDVGSANATTFLSVDTGQGANELYDMNQNVQNTDDVTFNTTTSNVFMGNLTWTYLFGYPAACGAGEYVSAIGDTLTCSVPTDTDTNNYTSSIGFTGTTTKTLNLERIGMSNLTAEFTDIDTTYTAGNGITITGTEINTTYDMDQDIQSTDAVTFTTVDTGQGANELYDMDQNVQTTDSVIFNYVNISESLKLKTGAIVNDIDTTAADSDTALITSGGVYDLLGNCAAGTVAQNITTSGVECVTDQSGAFVYSDYFNQALNTTSAVTFATIDTGQGANELYYMNQDVGTTNATTFATVDTGQGANELYTMNQDVETTDAVTFATVDTGQGANELYDMDQNMLTTSNVIHNNINSTTNISLTSFLNINSWVMCVNSTGSFGIVNNTYAQTWCRS